MSEQIEGMSKSELLADIRLERARLEQTLDALSAAQMTQPGLESGWSVKDTLAHIVAWEHRMVGWVRQTLREDKPDDIPADQEAVDRLNERIYREHRDKPLEEVLALFRRSYPEALKLVEEVPEEALVNPERFPWRAGAPLWRMVAANTSWHYREHREAIEEWLDSQAGS